MIASTTFDQVGGAALVAGAGLALLWRALRQRNLARQPTPGPVSQARLARMHIIDQENE